MKFSLISKRRSALMALAILSVLAFHANDMPIGFLNDVRAFGFAGVDVFILVSGMGLCLSLLRREQSFGAYMRRRAARILPAYYAVMVPLCVYNIARGFCPPSTLFWNLTTMQYWVRPAGGFNWYITGIMTFYLVTPALFALMRRAKNRTLAAALLCAAGYGVLALLLRDGWWQYCDVFFRFPTLVMGIFAGFAAAEDARPNAPLTVLAALLGTGCAAAHFAAPEVFPLAPAFSLSAAPLCLLLARALDALPDAVAGALGALGESSFEIYLLNCVFVEKREGLRRFLDFGEGHFAYYAIMLCVNVGGGILLHRLIEWLRGRVKNKLQIEKTRENGSNRA